jgi:hypothetical protein
MRRAGPRIRLIVLLAGVGLAACAPEVVRYPAALTPAAGSPGGTIEVVQQATVSVGPGYQRTIWENSVWTRMGRLSQGEVYKPVDHVFTVEGTHVHEAYLVLDGDRLVGFYLPVERSFSPAPDGPGTKLSIRRREP